MRGFPGSLADLAWDLDTETLMTLEAPTDSAVLWALVRRHLDAGKDPADAVLDVVTRTLAAAPGSRLNLLLLTADAHGGATLVATAVDHALSYRAGAGGSPSPRSRSTTTPPGPPCPTSPWSSCAVVKPSPRSPR